MAITPEPSSEGMSSGTKIGIGVGVALGVVLIAAAILAAIVLRRRKKARNQVTTQLLNADGESGKSELGDGSHGRFVPMQPMETQAKPPVTHVDETHELPSDNRYELDNQPARGELGTEGAVQQTGPNRYSWERGRDG